MPSMPNISWADASAFLSKTLLGPRFDVGAQPTPYRIPFYFTSKQRIGGATSIFNDTGSVSVENIPPAAPTQNPIVRMAVNPHTIRWSQPKRQTKRETIEGAVIFHFTNHNFEDNDLAVVTFHGTTGNIFSDHAFDGTTPPADEHIQGNISKLLIWHNLWQLTREQVAYNDSGTWVPNEFYIHYRTHLFPTGIRLTGYFNQALEFTEDAKTPNQRHYSFSFTVTDTAPKLNDISSTLGAQLSSPPGNVE